MTEDEWSVQLEMGRQLITLADLQADPELYSRALAKTEAIMEQLWQKKPTEYVAAANALSGQLNGLLRYADAARVGRVGLTRVATLQSRRKQSADSEEDELSDFEVQQLVVEQFCAVTELKRWPEAQTFLQENPNWGVRDLSELLNSETAVADRPVGLYAARLMNALGDKASARRILEAQLVRTPGVDPLYEEYLGLVGADALSLLDRLDAADRYQERPLIWKAYLQLVVGELDQAAATLQRAIEIDPSDGEEGQGDRMRVYALMSEVMSAKNDETKAKFFRDVVKAIRTSEQADRWFQVGAYQRAISLYREGLNFFQDAYCIQSRLAIRLAAEGRTAEALEHYRRAYELMPGSFGRVESHCFGCEHAFAGEKPQGIAEEVFTRLLREQPAKPQVYYLVGYLRQEQKRFQEAAGHYRKATELDPLYLNAWKKLGEVGAQSGLVPSERDDLEVKLLELDPGQRHVSPNLERVSNLPRLWRELRKAQQTFEVLPAADRLLPLRASTRRVVQLAKTDREKVRHDFTHRRQDFASVMLQHDFLEALQYHLANLNDNEP